MQDATFIYAESQSGPLHIGSIAIFEGRMNFDSIVESYRSRMHLIPRYRQRLARVPFNLAHAMMEDDPDFSIENHMFRHELPSGLSEEDAIEEMMCDYETVLDRDLPLWEVHVYDGLQGGRTAIMQKVHHCLVDGVSGVELLKVMFDLKQAPDPTVPPSEAWVPEPPSNSAERVLEAMRDLVSSSLDGAAQTTRDVMQGPGRVAEQAKAMAAAARTMARLASQKIARTPWNAGVVARDRAFAWSRLSFTDFRAIRTAFGGSLNDVVLAVLTEAAARYLKHHGYEAADSVLCIGCPVNVRHKVERRALGNRVSMMFPAAPAEPMDVVERLKLISRETDAIKEAGAAQALENLMVLGDQLPPTLIAAVSKVATFALDAVSSLWRISGWTPRPDGFALPPMGISFIATNVPGVQVPLYSCGHRCLDLLPLVPLGANLGYGVAILSYNQSMYVGMVCDPTLMPDVALMKSLVDETFSELKKRCEAQTGIVPQAFASIAAAAHL
ncbi:MAG TPA: wax ester/triacylglycerol synthase family O-acyltransferase [Candidatus Binataceae bacterium]